MTSSNTNTPVVDRNGRPSDPTPLATQALLREVTTLRELTDSSINGLKEKIETRLAAMDKALELLQRQADKVPSDTDIAVGRLEQLTDEKLKGFRELVITRFAERDQRRLESSQAQSEMVSAAFEAQKASVDKTERNFAELINQGRETQIQAKSSLEALINELKSRLDRGEGHLKGEVDQRGLFMGMASLVVAIVGVALAVAAFATR